MLKKKMRMLGLLASVCMFVTAVPFMGMAATSKAAETRNPIEMVYINVTSYIEAGDEEGHLDITLGSDLYSLGGTDWGTIPTDGWKIGDTPKVKIELHARSGNYFNKVTGAKKVIINGATYSAAKRANDDETLIVTMKLSPVKGELTIPETAEWVGYPLGKATWTKVANANAYELKLYRDGQPVHSVEKTSSNVYDFYPYMTQAGTYQFRVRAVPVSSEETTYITPGDWVYSDEMDLDDTDTMNARYNDGTSTSVTNPSQVGWVENSDGWRYRNTDGSYVANGWKAINGKWYLFGYDGYMLKGWQKVGSNTYYLSDNGDMQTGWQQINRFWYYLDPGDGRVLTGWLHLGNKWYYINPENSTLSLGWTLVGDQWYYMDPNDGGAMVTNVNIGGYYVNANGVWIP